MRAARVGTGVILFAIGFLGVGVKHAVAADDLAGPPVVLTHNGVSVNSLSLGMPRAMRLMEELIQHSERTEFVDPHEFPIESRLPWENGQRAFNALRWGDPFDGKLTLGPNTSLQMTINDSQFTQLDLVRSPSFWRRLRGDRGQRVNLLGDIPVMIGRGQLMANHYSSSENAIYWSVGRPRSYADLLTLFHEQGHAAIMADLTPEERSLVGQIYISQNTTRIKSRIAKVPTAIVLGHERTAWAHALRDVRRLRAQGLDPMPGVTLPMFQQEIKYRLSSYLSCDPPGRISRGEYPAALCPSLGTGGLGASAGPGAIVASGAGLYFALDEAGLFQLLDEEVLGVKPIPEAEKLPLSAMATNFLNPPGSFWDGIPQSPRIATPAALPVEDSDWTLSRNIRYYWSSFWAGAPWNQ